MVLAFAFVPVACRLTVRAYRTGALLLTLPIEKGEQFRIRYTHSVNRSPVTDTIEWTGETLMVREAHFKTFGAGIPIPADGIGKELIKVEDGYRLIGIDKPQENFLLMTEEIPDQTILYREREIRLAKLYGAGMALQFEVKPVSLLACILHDL